MLIISRLLVDKVVLWGHERRNININFLNTLVLTMITTTHCGVDVKDPLHMMKD